jgi:DUF2938 family protein
MNASAKYAVYAVLIGAGATLVTDAWTRIRKRLSGVAPPDYGLVGRWIAYMARGRFRHDPISSSPLIANERIVGWIAHYLIGIAFASILLAIWGIDWVRHPTIGPALVVGIGSVAAPLFILQPGMGLGFAASRTPNPSASRMRSVVMHAMFGVGLYAAGWFVNLLRA